MMLMFVCLFVCRVSNDPVLGYDDVGHRDWITEEKVFKVGDIVLNITTMKGMRRCEFVVTIGAFTIVSVTVCSEAQLGSMASPAANNSFSDSSREIEVDDRNDVSGVDFSSDPY